MISVASAVAGCIRRTHNCALRERLTLAPTVGRDLGNGLAHSGSRWFHGKDGVAGSIPAGGSPKGLTSANAVSPTFETLRSDASAVVHRMENAYLLTFRGDGRHRRL
jgi:hypothetical protein